MSTLPPPPAIPGSRFGHTARFFRNPFPMLEEAQAELGDIFSMDLVGMGHWVYLCSPALIKEMFKAPADVLVAGEVNRELLGFMLGEDSTFCLDGQAHRQRQRLIHPFLNKPSLIHGHVPLVRELALETLAAMPMDRSFPFLHVAHRLSLDVMLRVFFGTGQRHELAELATLFDTFAGKGLRSPLIPLKFLQIDLGRHSPWGRILHMQRRVREAFGKAINRRLDGASSLGDTGDAGDDRGILLDVATTQQKDGGTLSRESLLQEVINLLFAGHETTGTIMTWTLETLHSHPEVLDRVRQELADVAGDAPISLEHVPRLEWLQATIQETIRYRPIAPMAGVRLAKRPFEIGGHTVPEGSLVAQCFPRMARFPELYARPDHFDPEHFYRRRTKPFEWNPFGGGTRMCVGRGLAELELLVVIATFLQHADFEIAQDTVVPERQGLFFTPSQGLQLRMKHRNGSLS